MSERAKLRRRAGLTQAELALLVGLHAPQICLWERGQLQLKEEQVARIRAVLQAHVAEFMKSIIARGQHAASE